MPFSASFLAQSLIPNQSLLTWKQPIHRDCGHQIQEEKIKYQQRDQFTWILFKREIFLIAFKFKETGKTLTPTLHGRRRPACDTGTPQRHQYWATLVQRNVGSGGLVWLGAGTSYKDTASFENSAHFRNRDFSLLILMHYYTHLYFQSYFDSLCKSPNYKTIVLLIDLDSENCFQLVNKVWFNFVKYIFECHPLSLFVYLGCGLQFATIQNHLMHYYDYGSSGAGLKWIGWCSTVHCLHSNS